MSLKMKMKTSKANINENENISRRTITIVKRLANREMAVLKICRKSWRGISLCRRRK